MIIQTSQYSLKLRVPPKLLRRWLVVAAMSLAAPLASALTPPSAPLAASPAAAQTAAPGLPIPGFWDPRRRPERPDLRLTLIRFMSEVDYPPFNYAGPDGNPAGFNVDLARAICDELKIACTMQMRRFDTLVESLAENRGDAAIASLAVSAETRRKVDFSDPYYRPVARFAARRGAGLDTVLPERIEGKTVAVVAGTAHEAYLRALFTEAAPKPYPTAEEARTALAKGEVDLLFGDGYSLAFWLNGTEAGGCCVFVGGPFVESRYFGEGVGIAVKKGNDQLRLALNWALFRLWEKGKFADLWLKYFPVNPF
ncbi:Putative ABC transporter arginine-binding protein 2 [Rhodoplanes serenus]|uniref:ABC transporter arginine-binding protein 2 n=2 Tax=Nitrobacteraceae TaxID=41294 RepID=A0A3S4B0S8_9BRAD|nr:Putative ABC transporter arginine-binding protein 2 [Rhodoplanes serenus]